MLNTVKERGQAKVFFKLKTMRFPKLYAASVADVATCAPTSGPTPSLGCSDLRSQAGLSPPTQRPGQSSHLVNFRLQITEGASRPAGKCLAASPPPPGVPSVPRRQRALSGSHQTGRPARSSVLSFRRQDAAPRTLTALFS